MTRRPSRIRPYVQQDRSRHRVSLRTWMTAAVLVAGLVSGPRVEAGDSMSRGSRPEPPVEICEAFPWDVPVEQSFTAELVLRWRRAMTERGARPARVVPARGLTFARAP